MPSGVNFITNQHIFPYRTLTHIDISRHISIQSQVFSSFFHNMVRSTEERFAWSAWSFSFRREEDRDHAGRAAIDNEAVVTEDALGRRHGVAQHRATARGEGWFVCHVLLHVSTHISRRVTRASRLWVHGCNEGRVLAAALINAWISVEPCCTVARCPQTSAGVWHRARPQQRPEADDCEHWPAKQVICG